MVAVFLLACSSSSSGDGTTSTGSSTGEATTGTTGASTGADTTAGPDSSGGASCGDGVLDEGEECDGEDLGGKSCSDVDAAFVGGTLACGASCTFDTSACEIGPGEALVAINEIVATPVTSGPYNGAPDAIELFNAGTGSADLSGWRISDDPLFAVDHTYTFPADTTLDAGASLVLVGIGINGMGELPFGISQDSAETIVLDDGAAVVDMVDVPAYAAVVSWCRVPDGTGAWTYCDQTLGDANVAATQACGNGTIEGDEACDGSELGGASCESLDLGFSGGELACSPTCVFDVSGCTTDAAVVINELSSSSPDPVELFNSGGSVVDISGWILTDDPVGPDYDPALDAEELVFAEGTVLAPGEYLVVEAGMLPGEHPFGLSGGGDQVSLVRLDPLVVIDVVAYGDGEAATSYCRQPNGPGGTWTPDCTPSFGSAN